MGILPRRIRTSDCISLSASEEILHESDRIIGRFAVEDGLVRVTKNVEEDAKRVARLGWDEARRGEVALDCLVGADSITKAEIVLQKKLSRSIARKVTPGQDGPGTK